MNANPTLLQMKYARVVNHYAEKFGIEPEAALDLFYRSSLYREVSTGVSDLHCMSDDYLADELHEEWTKGQS